jgi:hypothetical protein
MADPTPPKPLLTGLAANIVGALGVAVVTLVIVTVLLVGGAVGTALGFAMGVPV